ncbi:MAG: hypothetical protein HYY21_08730 [Candidatus Tectomicrobia bacterium]|nr:hypothetical protein [Candidatus Tectomicrobia bacterium]
MEVDPRVPGKESKEAAERLSRILEAGIPGIQEDILYQFAKTGFQLNRRSQKRASGSLFLSFAQLRELNDEELRGLIRTHLQNNTA